MTKYQTGRDNDSQQKERVVAEWTEHPFTGIGKRSWGVQHRVDTSSILQNQYFHWLEELEDASGSLSRGSSIKGGRQGDLSEVFAGAE